MSKTAHPRPPKGAPSYAKRLAGGRRPKPPPEFDLSVPDTATARRDAEMEFYEWLQVENDLGRERETCLNLEGDDAHLRG